MTTINDIEVSEWDQTALEIHRNNLRASFVHPDGTYNINEPISSVDMVNSPPHYNQGSKETIEVIKDSMSHLEFAGYLQGNVMKYLCRYGHKGKPEEDLKKAQWYLSKLIENEGLRE